jgi:MFS family permease
MSFALVGGAVTERLPRRTVMLASDTVRGAAVATIASLAAAGSLEIVHLVVAGAVFGAAEASFMPAMSAIYPDVVPADLLLQANALRSTSTTLAETLIGPAVGGILVAAAAAACAFGGPDQPRA